ncbi:hypothetical protein [Chitinimonas naiadis]
MRMLLLTVVLLLALLDRAQADCREGYQVPLIPLGYASNTSKQGVQSGFYVDLFREVERRTRCKLILEELPAERARALRRLQRTPIFGPSGDPAAGTSSQIFIPMAQESMELVVREDLAIQKLEQALAMPDLVFGSIRGASYGNVVNELLQDLPPARRDISIDAETVYRKLDAGRIGATFGNAYVYRWYLDGIKSQGKVRIVKLPLLQRVLVGVVLDTSAMAPADVPVLKQAFETARDDGSFRRMMAQYLGDELARERIYVPGKGSR